MSRTGDRSSTKAATRRKVNNATKSTVRRAKRGIFKGRIK